MTSDEPATFDELRAIRRKLITTSSLTPEREEQLNVAWQKLMLSVLHWCVDVRKGKVFIPNTARTQSGLLVQTDPRRAVDITDRVGIERALQEAMKAGNVVIPPLDPDDKTRLKTILKLAGVRSWKAYEQYSAAFGIDLREGAYTIDVTGRIGTSGAGRWDQHRTILAKLPEGTPVSEIVDVILKHVQERPDLL